MNRAFAIFLVILIFFFQFSVLGSFLKSGRVPNLFVAFAAAAAVIFGFEKSATVVLLAGLLLDVGGSLLIGSGAIALTALLWAIDQIKMFAELRLKRYIFAVIFSSIVALALVLFDLMYGGIGAAQKYFFASGAVAHVRQTNSDYFWKILYTSLSALPIYYLLRRFGKLREGNIIVRR